MLKILLNYLNLLVQPHTGWEDEYGRVEATIKAIVARRLHRMVIETEGVIFLVKDGCYYVHNGNKWFGTPLARFEYSDWTLIRYSEVCLFYDENIVKIIQSDVAHDEFARLWDELGHSDYNRLMGIRRV